MTSAADHPLEGVRFVEFDGLGPAPYAAMVLTDLGAVGSRVTGPERGTMGLGTGPEVYHRGRPAVPLDLKTGDGLRTARDLVREADLLVEGYRPGVMERLGLGPAECLRIRPSLVYGRVTGYGQSGSLATRAGHDVNYLATAGALDLFRRRGEAPVPPLNLVADFAGGALALLTGMLAALVDARATGRGRVVDAAMVDGVAALLGSVCGRLADGSWSPTPGTNLLDTGSPFYDVYETADGRYVAVGAIEDKFYLALLDGLGLELAVLPDRWDRTMWPQLREVFAARFRDEDLAHWVAIFADRDACVDPVLTLAEAQSDTRLRERGTYVERDGVIVPGTAPRLSWCAP